MVLFDPLEEQRLASCFKIAALNARNVDSSGPNRIGKVVQDAAALFKSTSKQPYPSYFDQGEGDLPVRINPNSHVFLTSGLMEAAAYINSPVADISNLASTVDDLVREARKQNVLVLQPNNVSMFSSSIKPR